MAHQSEDLPAANSRIANRPRVRSLPLWIVAGLAVVVVAGVLFFAVRTIDPPGVPVARVARRDLAASIASNGRVEPIDPQLVVAHLDSFVRDVSVTEGSVVKPGQLLVTLEASDLRAQLARAREELLAAREQMQMARDGGNAEELAKLAGDRRRVDAELVKLRRDRDALQRLAEKQAATADEVAQAVLGLEKAEAEQQFLVSKRADIARRASLDGRRAGLLAERARQTILTLEDQLRSTEVAAVAAGTIYSLPVKAGQHVRVGDTLAEVADLRRVRVRAFIDEPELGSVRVGQTVLVTWDALAGRTWTGQTVQIPKSVEPRGGRSVGPVLCSVENDDMKLLPNINVDVRIRTEERPHVLAVPRSAVHSAADHRYVFVVEDRRLRRQAITVGIASTNDFEVLAGLSEGDVVALQGEAKLVDGLAVRSVAR